MTHIAIIDYQMGNLRSVQKGFEKVGYQAEISSDPEVIRKADRVVLPGVGAFGDAIAELHRRNLVEVIREVAAKDRPLLGICLGLQLLFEVGFEGGRFEGLGILPGTVERFSLPPEWKVPHMGWNQGKILGDYPAFRDIANNSYFYFVHSYYVKPTDRSIVAIESDYGHPFCAAVVRGNLVATQFHPEKSQENGLKILKNFAEL